jgi:trans-aconitate methyltransferase
MADNRNDDLAPVRAYWNTIAATAPDGCRDHWIDSEGRPLSERLYDEVAEYVAAQLPRGIGPAPAILEVGCGTGRILSALQARLPGAALWGIDVAEEQIREAKTRVKSAVLSSQDLHQFIVDQGRQMRAGYELIFAHSVTQYFPSSDYFAAFLDEATELLRPGGCLCLLDVSVTWYYEQMRGQPPVSALTPLKNFVKRLIGYKPRPRPEASTVVEVLNGKNVEVPVFRGFWADPEMIEAFAGTRFSEYRMEYQLFPSKPVGYRKYRPIFIMRNKTKEFVA